jgi:hypothetical protein
MTNPPNPKMSPTFRGVWLVFAAALLANIAAIVLLILNPDIPIAPGWGVRGFPTTMSLSFGLLGALILSRYPRHRIGWLFAITGLVGGVQAFCQEYGFYALYGNHAGAAGGEIAAWVVNWIWVLLLITFILIFVLHPDGKFLSPGWRVFVGVSLINFSILIFLMAFAPGPLESSITAVDNPFGLEGFEEIYRTAIPIVNIGFVVSMAGAFGALFQRYRRSGGIERQQLKWFLYAVALLALTSPTGGLAFPWHLAFMAVMVFLPAAAAIGILRYRLYDIDLIIRRTLQYSVLTGLLALAYFGGVVTLQGMLRPLTGSAESPLVTVITTLGIAALFTPLRRRVQAFIDRRFYRKKYDAEQALAQFAIAARDEVDMDKLAAALMGVVDETMQPEKVSLWLRVEEQARVR